MIAVSAGTFACILALLAYRLNDVHELDAWTERARARIPFGFSTRAAARPRLMHKSSHSPAVGNAKKSAKTFAMKKAMGN